MLLSIDLLIKKPRTGIFNDYSEIGNMQTIMLSYGVYWSTQVLRKSKYMENDLENVI